MTQRFAFLSLLTLLGSAALLTACGKSSSQLHLEPAEDYRATLANGNEIEFDVSVPVEQQKALAQDIVRIQDITWSDPDAELKNLLGIEAVGGESLGHWLRQRIHFIVGEKFTANFRLQSSFDYHPEVFSTLDIDLDPAQDPSVLMINLGTTLYHQGLVERMLLGVQVNDQKIKIVSPRAGIIQIGARLFGEVHTMSTGDNLAASIARIAVLFHEARHSDGHGENVGFPHALCPAGYPYSGKLACEDNQNGPYALELAILKAGIRACSTCTQPELERLRIRETDLESRILPTAAEHHPDPRPERII